MTVVCRVQVSLVGDFDPEVAEQAFLEFMGTIPAREEPLPLPHVPITFNTALPVGDRHVVRLQPPIFLLPYWARRVHRVPAKCPTCQCARHARLHVPAWHGVTKEF